MAPESETEVRNWYDHQHHFERLSVPGFLSARRHLAPRGTPKYSIFYVSESPGVRKSQPDLDRLNDPADRIRRSMPNIRNNSRSVCRDLGAFGTGHDRIGDPTLQPPGARPRGRTCASLASSGPGLGR